MRVDVRGVPVHFVDVGEGRPIVLLHGYGADHRMWTTALEPIIEGRPGWRRLYLDLPGHGQTPGAEWITGQDHMLDVMLGFVDAVIPGQRFALAGASYGGYLALGAVSRRAVGIAGLALLTPAVTLDRGDRALPPRRVFERDDAVVASLEPDEQGWLDVAVLQTPDVLAGFRAGVLPGLRIADRAFLDRLETSPGLSADTGQLGEPFEGPTLILAGRQDNITGYADTIPLLEAFPRATLAILDRAGHALRQEQRPLFRALMSEWLDRIERDEAPGSPVESG